MLFLFRDIEFFRWFLIFLILVPQACLRCLQLFATLFLTSRRSIAAPSMNNSSQNKCLLYQIFMNPLFLATFFIFILHLNLLGHISSVGVISFYRWKTTILQVKIEDDHKNLISKFRFLHKTYQQMTFTLAKIKMVNSCIFILNPWTFQNW